MSIKRNMKKYILQKRISTKNKAGQKIDSWDDVKEIDVAIYPANYTILTSNNIKYAECTNTGLTTEKAVEEEVNRLVKDKEVYEITFANPIGKYTQLYLKRVVYHG